MQDSTIIGPFLGPRGECGVEIFIALPASRKTAQLHCELSDNNGVSEKAIAESNPDDIYNLFAFKFTDLSEDKIYSYKFFVDGSGQELDLEGGLSSKDCSFRVLGGNNTETAKSFILMSCHSPFATAKGSAVDGWAMWDKLGHFLQSDKSAKNSSVRLLIMGGDQVYNDDVEKELIDDLEQGNKDGQKLLRQRFIKQYQKYWGHLSYRKALAGTLSVVMWDDHDITDGWGGRPESFGKEGEFKDNWESYFAAAREIFVSYQHSRNPQQSLKLPQQGQHSPLSAVLNWGNTKFVLADFRSEKDSRKNQIWSEEHKNKVLQDLENTPDSICKIFFVSPVVPLRTNFAGDKRLGDVAGTLFKLRRWCRKLFKKRGSWYRKLFKRFKDLKKVNLWISLLLLAIVPVVLILVYFVAIKGSLWGWLIYTLWNIFPIVLFIVLIISIIPELPDLSDDLEDGLSSRTNMNSLKEILDVLVGLARKGKDVYILSGDIHIGGLTEIIDTREEQKVKILQIVSSPIAYKPMPKVVAGFTTTTSEMVLRDCTDNKKLFARNIFYLSKRNFVQLFPNGSHDFAYFHFEGHQFPVIFPDKFSKL